mmetsp:Transcript_26875/g.32568  ORF Transcript_26875/g.32568 Transcript_26875/m.32568 type:complete len:237 (+) Transcript_26875:826-1536(+)
MKDPGLTMSPSLETLKPSNSFSKSPFTSALASIIRFNVWACVPINSSTVLYSPINFWAASIVSDTILLVVSLSLSSPMRLRPGIAPSRLAAAQIEAGSQAAFFNVSLFSIKRVANSWHRLSLLCNIILHNDLLMGNSSSCVHVTSAVFLPSRRCTTRLTASTSSMTKMTSLKPSVTGTLSWAMWYFPSKNNDASSAFVDRRERGTLTIDRPVSSANALIREVLPVPGGPWRSSPSL